MKETIEARICLVSGRRQIKLNLDNLRKNGTVY